MENKKQSRIILFGRPGTGKSSLGNTLIGKQHFKVSASSLNVTQSCDSVQVKSESGRNLKIVETPGISDKSMIDEIKNNFEFLSPGPHAIIIVLMPNRFTDKDDQAVDSLFEFFGDDHFLKNTILVMNRKSEIIGENPNSTEYIENITSSGIKRLYNGCEKRFVLVENKQEWEDRREDAKKVFQEIDKMDYYYDWEYFNRVHEQNESLEKIKKLEEKVQSLENLIKEERKKKNENNITDGQGKCSVN